MKKVILLAALFFISGYATAINAAEAPPKDVVIFSRSQVDTAFSLGGPILLTSKYKVQTGRRVAPGAVEIHDNDTDIFYVTEGTATIVTGGTASGGKLTAPGETRGGIITGGVAHKLSKGDVMVIPKGIPHWFTEVPGTFLYFVVKVTD